MKKIVEIIVKELKGHNVTGDLIKAMVRATTAASNIDFTEKEKSEIYLMIIHEMNNDFDPLAAVNVF